MAILEEFFPLRRDAIKPGPDRLQLLMQDTQGQAALRGPSLLVVGTNGKGTTSLFLEAFLLQAQIRVGTYTSPHFVDPLERIRIGGRTVDADLALRARDLVLLWRDKHLADASFFEITTAIALLCFSWARCDLVILEAGLGGRLDSTNASSPLLTVLTSVGLDHTDRLGNTLASIAFEKAMATRRHRPLVCGHLSAEAASGVHRALTLTGARWITPQPHNGQMSQDTLSPRQRNALTAWMALQTLESELRRNHLSHLAQRLVPALEAFSGPQEAVGWFQTVPLPGRFDARPFGRLCLVLDTAHNPAAAMGLLQEWQNAHGTGDCQTSSPGLKPALVFGSLRDKNYKETFRTLATLSNTGVVVTFDHESSLNTEEAQSLVEEVAAEKAFDVATAQELSRWLQNYERSIAQTLEEGRATVLIAGSFALIGQVMKELQLNPESNRLPAPIMRKDRDAATPIRTLVRTLR